MDPNYTLKFSFDEWIGHSSDNPKDEFLFVTIEYADGTIRHLNVWTNQCYERMLRDPVNGGSDENLRKYTCYPDIIVETASRDLIAKSVAVFLKSE